MSLRRPGPCSGGQDSRGENRRTPLGKGPAQAHQRESTLLTIAPPLTRLTLAAAALTLSGTSGAWAGEQQPFHCDVEGGHYTAHNLNDVGRALSARITFTRMNKDRKWGPSAGLLFVLPGERQYAGVQVYVRFDRPDELLIGMRTSKADEPTTFARTGVRTPVDLKVTLDEEGRLTATIAGVSKTVRIKQSAVERGIATCSSGAFTFETLSAAIE